MISIKKDFSSLPAKLLASNRLTLVLDSIATKNKHAFNSKVYRDATLESLTTLYNSKCAYCETDTEAGAPMQVEHYRPKAKVTEDSVHTGYYWLAYEWSNLILSCSKCNNKKRNRFPISGVRISCPQLHIDGHPLPEYTLANSLPFTIEGALLLHPEIDDVENQFIFQPNGQIQALNPKAEFTIKVCGLNRKELVFKRLSILNELVSDLKRILSDFISGQTGIDQCRYAIKLRFEKLALLQRPENIYSRFGYFLFYKFDLFVTNSLDDKQKAAVTKFFEQFKNGSL